MSSNNGRSIKWSELPTSKNLPKNFKEFIERKDALEEVKKFFYVKVNEYNKLIYPLYHTDNVTAETKKIIKYAKISMKHAKYDYIRKYVDFHNIPMKVEYWDCDGRDVMMSAVRRRATVKNAEKFTNGLMVKQEVYLRGDDRIVIPQIHAVEILDAIKTF